MSVVYYFVLDVISLVYVESDAAGEETVCSAIRTQEE